MLPKAHRFENNWYYVTEPRALADLRIHGKEITNLVPFWFAVTGNGSLEEQSDAQTISLARQLGLPMLALVYSTTLSPLIHTLLTNEEPRRTLVFNILNLLTGKGFSGVNIDFEFVPPEDRPYMTLFMAELYHALKPYGFLVTISVPAKVKEDPAHPFSGAYDYPALATYSDQLYIMAYDEHFTEPGPIASIGFVRTVLTYALSVIPREKIRLGMAVYGRDWSKLTEFPRELPYEEAIALAVRHGSAIRYDDEAQESTYTYTENGVTHTVWFEEVRSFAAKLNVVLQQGIPGIVVWRLGLEDPRIWDLLSQITSNADLPKEVSWKPYPNVPENELDKEILAEMHKSKIVGVSAAFVKDGRVIWANGYGWADLEKGKLATRNTIYRIASISKTITATALLQLWEQGKFGLDDDISYYLGFMVRNPKYPNDKITFGMLLTHTSSILDGTSDCGYEKAISSSNPPLLRDLLVPGGKAYCDLTWGDFRPGTNFVYSNFGFGIIGSLVETLSGERFDRYAINHIFRPLGMDASYDVADIVNIDKVAVLYKTSGNSNFIPACDYFGEGEKPTKKPYKLPLGNYYIGPAGAVRSSVVDLAKFVIAHMNGGVYDGVRILRKDTVDLMHQIQWYGYGLGGFFRQIGLSFHITDALAGRRLTGHAGEACGLVSDM
ncbi:MAG: serine hydrolase, partial [Firmicutes bacterium]|nr:serine hydrolase [Bacillota bacterium]